MTQFFIISCLLLLPAVTESQLDPGVITSIIKQVPKLSDEELGNIIIALLPSAIGPTRTLLTASAPLIKALLQNGMLGEFIRNTLESSGGDGIPEIALKYRLANLTNVIADNFKSIKIDRNENLTLRVQTSQFFDQLKYGPILDKVVFLFDPSINISAEARDVITVVFQDVMRTYFRTGKFNFVNIIGVVLGHLIKFPVVEYECDRRMRLYGSNILQGEDWALRMVDATAKLPDGVLYGKQKWVGVYDECIEIDVKLLQNSTDQQNRHFQETIHIRGGYFKINIKPPESFKQTFDPVMLKNSEPDDYKLVWSFCFPKECSEKDVENMFGLLIDGVEKYLDIKLRIMSVLEVSKGNNLEDPIATMAICIIVLFSTFVAGCTFYDVWSEYRRRATAARININKIAPSNAYSLDEIKPNIPAETEQKPLGKATNKSTCFKIVEATAVSFSAYKTARYLLRFKHNKNAIKVIDGVRTLSMNWIVLGHTFAVGVPVAANAVQGFQLTKRWTFDPVTTGPYLACETFLVLSAILNVCLLFKEFDGNEGKVAVRQMIWYYLHRWIRLAPLMYIMVLFTMSMVMYSGDGPFWDETTFMQAECRKSGWYNFLFIQNFIPVEKQRCLPWTWYVALDMQFHVVAPLFLIPLYKFRRIGFALLAAIFIGCTVATGYYQYQYQENDPFYTFKTIEGELYIMPYARMPSYIVGTFAGYWIYLNSIRGKPLKISKIVVTISWMLATVIGTMCIYFPTIKNWDGVEWTKLLAAIYETTSRPIWSICVSWIIFACCAGYGGVVNVFLSWKIFAPFSRVTYAMFILHPIVIALYFFNLQIPNYVTDFFAVYLYTAFVTISWIFAVLLTLAFSQPFINLETAVLHRRRKDKVHAT